MYQFKTGDVATVKAAFKREPPEHGAPFDVGAWTPGFRAAFSPPGDARPVCDGYGEVIYTVVDYHILPKPYPARVFYTRQFKDPDGKVFGKSKLRVTPVYTFWKLCNVSLWPTIGQKIPLAETEADFIDQLSNMQLE